MKVRDLRALLRKLDDSNLDPDDTVIFDPKKMTFIVMRVRPGMHQPMDDDPELYLSEADKQFLRELRIL